MTSPSRINAADRVAPQRAAGPKPAPRARWVLPGAIAAGVVCLVGGGLGAFYLLPATVEAPKQRISAIKLGPLPEMPDLRDGVPALMTKAAPAAAQRPSSTETKPVQATPDVVEDANRKAMASTIASTVLRPAIPTPPATTAPSVVAPAVAPREAAPKSPAVVASAQPVRQVEVKPLRGATSVGGTPAAAAAAHLQALPAMSAPAAPTVEVITAPAAPTVPEPSVPAPQPIAAEPAPPRAASLSPAAPLPPRRPSFASAEPGDRTATPRPAARTPAPPRTAAATRPPATAAEQPAAAPAEERSLLGIPVPRYIPSGRDIRDAASSITDAVTSLPSRF